MKNLALCGGLAVVMAGAVASSARAQSPPVFELKVAQILDADFNTKPCLSCFEGQGGSKELTLGEAAAGDTLVIRAFASAWDDNPLRGTCTSGNVCRTDLPGSCSTMHCSDTEAPCFNDEVCNVVATCIPDVCSFDPDVGSFQWTLDSATLRNSGPGTIDIAQLPCDAVACFDCQDAPFDEGGPGGACDACSCFHKIDFACLGLCSCCPGPTTDLACSEATGLCQAVSTAFIDTSDADWILQGKAARIAVDSDNFVWVGTISSGTVGATEQEFPSYMGTAILTLPACGGGQYAINFADDFERSFLNDGIGFHLTQPTYEPVIINLAAVADPCVGVSCDDGDPCTIDSCNNDSCGAVCENSPKLCTPVFLVCNANTGICEDLRGACCTDDGATCDFVSLSSCDTRGGVFQGVGTICDELLTVCEPGGSRCETLTADFPPNCAVDARQPSTIDGVTLQGWETVDVTVGPAGCELTADQLAVDVVPTPSSLGILSVAQVGGSATIQLDGIIPTRNWTCVSLADFPGQQVCVGNLPGDVNSDGTANPALDLGAEIDCINNAGTCDEWQENIDRTGTGAGVLDITRVIDLFNGAGSYESFTGASFGGTSCPSAP